MDKFTGPKTRKTPKWSKRHKSLVCTDPIYPSHTICLHFNAVMYNNYLLSVERKSNSDVKSCFHIGSKTILFNTLQ